MIRAAREADLPAIRQLLVDTWHATYDTIYGLDRVTEITDEWHSLEALKARLARQEAVFLVAEEGGRIAGMAFAAQMSSAEGRLHQLYVLPDFHGRGLGSRLLAAVENGLGDINALSLEVEEANTSARRFYERHGFVQHGSTANCGAADSGIPALVYVKSIA
mgnify:CR=1 FL=1